MTQNNLTGTGNECLAMIEEITQLCEKVGEQVVSEFPDKVKYEITRQIDRSKLSSFTICLCLNIISRINEDNFGVCIEVNAHKSSFYENEIRAKENELFYLADLSYADGAGIADMKESILKPFDKKSVGEVKHAIMNFINSHVTQLSPLIKELMDRPL